MEKKKSVQHQGSFPRSLFLSIPRKMLKVKNSKRTLALGSGRKTFNGLNSIQFNLFGLWKWESSYQNGSQWNLLLENRNYKLFGSEKTVKNRGSAIATNNIQCSHFSMLLATTLCSSIEFVAATSAIRLVRQCTVHPLRLPASPALFLRRTHFTK